MAKTTTDLALRVLQLLKVVASDETASAADDTFVKAEYAVAQQELEFRGVSAWAASSIPDAFFTPLAKYMAARVAQDFGRDYMDEDTALIALKRIVRKPYIGNAAEVDWM